MWFTKLLKALPAIASTVLGIGGARAGARVNEAGLNANEDKLALERAAAEQNNARQNAVTSANLRSNDQSDAVLGGYREGVKDVHFNRPSGVEDTGGTGGARPSAIIGLSAMGHNQKADALARILADNPTLKTPTPGLTPVPQANGFDKFLNITGGLAGAGALVNTLLHPAGSEDGGAAGTVTPSAPVTFGNNPFSGSGSGLKPTTPLPDPNAPWFKKKPPVNVFGG